MASTPVFNDRVQETSTTTGTGTYTLAGAVTGFQSFAIVGNLKSCQYAAFDVDANGIPSGGWEVGVGTYTTSGTTLSRDKIWASSNSGSAVSWSAGTRRITLTILSESLAQNPLLKTGRLTVVSGNATPATDQLTKGTIYYTSLTNNGTITTNNFQIVIWDGSGLRFYDSAEISLALTMTSGKNYDVFIYDNSGTLTLELSAAWTNDTTRADALAAQSGLIVKSGTTTRCWVGTIRANGTNLTEDSAANRLIYNAYNQKVRSLLKLAADTTWNYSTDTFRQANANAANQLSVVLGNPETVNIHLQSWVSVPNNSDATVSIGVDSTTTPDTLSVNSNCSSINVGTTATATALLVGGTVSGNGIAASSLVKSIAAGFHTLVWLEKADTATTSWQGVNGSYYNTGMSGIVTM